MSTQFRRLPLNFQFVCVVRGVKYKGKKLHPFQSCNAFLEPFHKGMIEYESFVAQIPGNVEVMVGPERQAA